MASLMTKLEAVCQTYAIRNYEPKRYRKALREFADTLDETGDERLSDFMEELHKLAHTKRNREPVLHKAFATKTKVR